MPFMGLSYQFINQFGPWTNDHPRHTILALSSELCDVLRDTGIYKLYIYEQNSCLVLLNLSTLRGM